MLAEGNRGGRQRVPPSVHYARGQRRPSVSSSLWHGARAPRIAKPCAAPWWSVCIVGPHRPSGSQGLTMLVERCRAHARPSVCTSLVGCPCLAAWGDERDARRASGGGVSLRGESIAKQRRDDSVRAGPSRDDQRAWALIRLSRARRRNTPSWTVNWAGGALGRVDTRRSAARSCRASI